MSNPRPLRPEVARQYGQELAAAEQMKNDPSAYGDPNVKFDPIAEMQLLQQANVTDSSFLEASMQDWKEQGIPIPEPTTVVEEDKIPAEDEAEEEMMPSDPVEKLKWVALKLREVDPKSPDAQTLYNWKQMHGNIFVLQVGEDVYIYRYIKRQEWAQMMANPAMAKMRPEQVEDIIVEKCLLWPRLSPEKKAAMPAGAVGMLSEQIRIQSQFLDPMQVANITVKL
jgi:hypothetical protein